MLKAGVFVAFGIMIHNFPEGIATFVATLKNIRFGLAIAVAIGLHNIAEGLAVSVPIYAATKSRYKAFWWSFLSSLAEPIGAVIAGLLLLPFLNPTVFAWAFDELMPLSRSCGGSEHIPIVGVLCGMLLMIFSLWLLQVVNI